MGHAYCARYFGFSLPCQLEESVARYLSQLDEVDWQEPTEALAAKVTRLTEKPTKLKQEMGKLAVYEKQMVASPDQQISLTDPDSRSMATSGRGSGQTDANDPSLPLSASKFTRAAPLCAVRHRSVCRL